MPSWFTQVGTGGTFVLIVLMLLFNFLKSRKAPEKMGGVDLTEVNRRLERIEDRTGANEQKLGEIYGAQMLMIKLMKSKEL